MRKTKLTHNLIIVIPILLAFVVVCGIIYINLNKSNEPFTTNTDKKQIDNLIATKYTSENTQITEDIDRLQQKGFDNPDTKNINEAAVLERRNNKSTDINEAVEGTVVTSFTPTNKRSITLDDVYVIKQLNLKGVSGDFRIGIKNSARNKISYVSGLELHHDAITKMEIHVSGETKIKVLFQNNYSNNSFTFEGPLPNREFIVTPDYYTIFFHHTLLANKVVVLDVKSGNVIYNNIKLYCYTPSIDDVNRFK